ncbi:hypothetical protein PV04_05304 [Phialophora macrospora]|uniref:Protein kinase domain-containing protein n=1 Tax=Phialophora macrospora TaxID=1851006 RepID=A0A0D2E518_9EURO|nr:hypothetical protein PV04_05304 [Phialophora macrospora]
MNYGTCQVKGSSGLEYDSRVSIVKDHEDLSESAIRDFHLRVYWDYGRAQIKPLTEQQLANNISATSYAGMIKKEMEKKLVRNFLTRRYIARRDLDVFLSPPVIEQPVKEDKTLHLEPEAQARFITRIQSRSPKLFAICVYRHSTMAFLKHLLYAPHNCQDLPEFRPRIGMECEAPRYGCTSPEIKLFVECLPVLFAEKITRNYQHRELDSGHVLPLHHTGDYDDTKDDHAHLPLGNGSFGNVFCRLTAGILREPLVPAAGYESPDRQFAVKKFESTDETAFHQERNEVHHILYDRARCNLRTYTTEVRPSDLDRPHVLWFLRQLDGLARAIGHVHHFKRPTLSDPTPPDEKYGRHNDIKRENILVFKRALNQNPVFKITDFGLGVFADAQGGNKSQKTRNVAGSQIYWAPDYARKGFETLRQNYTGHNPRAKEDRFWYATGRGSNKQYHLKAAVRDLICELRMRHCAKLRAFGHVIDAIEKLLCCDPEKRMAADRLMALMASVLTQAVTDLRKTFDFYLLQHRKKVGESDSSAASVTLETERIDPDIGGRSPVSRSPSRANSVNGNAFSHIGAGSGHLRDEDSPGEAGELGKDLEDLSASARPDDEP